MLSTKDNATQTALLEPNGSKRFQMARILVADDHSVVRGGLKQFLSSAPDLEIAAEAESGRQAIEMVASQSFDLVLLDIALPDVDGLEVLRRIKGKFPNLPVLIFSMYPEEDYALAALNAGAAGYLMKDSDPDEILGAVRRAAKGARYLSPRLAERLLAGSVTTPDKLPHEALSAREFEVMLMVSRGKRLNEIGERLHLSPKTVSTYRARVLRKMGFTSNAELTRYVIDRKLDPR
jgi:DNA-binding NarL/FixJ family response regulator